MARQKVIWSPVEEEYLRKHKEDSINQLTIALSKSRHAIQKKLKEQDGKPTKAKAKKKRSNIGKRPDCGGMFFRSGWEANVFRYYRWQWDMHGKKISVQFEPRIFSFAEFGVLKGTVSYTPDFLISTPNNYYWLEVKGYLKPSDKTRLRRFKKFFPEEFSKLRAITGSEKTEAAKFFKSMNIPVEFYYNDVNKKYRSIIPGWE